MSEAQYLRARKVIDRRIRLRGMRALLRRTSGDRECWVLEAQLTAAEKRALKNPTHHIFSVSPIGVTVPPSKEDSLVTFVQPESVPPVEDATYRQVAPVDPFQPGGIIIFWELQVEKV